MAKKKARAKAGKARAKRVAKKRVPAKRSAKTVKAKPRAKAARKSVRQAKPKTLESTLEKIGEVTHYFPHVNAAAVKILKGALKVGDEIYLKGHTTDFKEKVASIQLDHASIPEGKPGMEIGLLVKSRVRIGDSVYRL